jgi:RNA polymerase sigma-70 factor (ECF subfamily)
MGEVGTMIGAHLRSGDELRLPAANEDVAATAARRARALVVDHFDFVWRLLCRLGVPASDVDDAAQQVFIIATSRLASIEQGRERTFLFGTALRTAATLRRNLRRREKWVKTAPADAPSPAGTPHDELERRQALALLDEVLSGLSDELRVVFVLSELEDLTAPEVAELEGIPVGTVASRLRRARKEFSERLRRVAARRWREP